MNWLWTNQYELVGSQCLQSTHSEFRVIAESVCNVYLSTSFVNETLGSICWRRGLITICLPHYEKVIEQHFHNTLFCLSVSIHSYTPKKTKIPIYFKNDFFHCFFVFLELCLSGLARGRSAQNGLPCLYPHNDSPPHPLFIANLSPLQWHAIIHALVPAPLP